MNTKYYLAFALAILLLGCENTNKEPIDSNNSSSSDSSSSSSYSSNSSSSSKVSNLINPINSLGYYGENTYLGGTTIVGRWSTSDDFYEYIFENDGSGSDDAIQLSDLPHPITYGVSEDGTTVFMQTEDSIPTYIKEYKCTEFKNSCCKFKDANSTYETQLCKDVSTE